MAFAMPVTPTTETPGPATSRPAELEPSILGRCRSLDPVAFRAFVVRYESAVFALLLRMMGRACSRAEVEDLAQETFLRAYRAFPTFDEGAAARPSTWLLTIATRIALDERKRRVLPIAPLAAAEAVASPRTAGPAAQLSRAELGRAIEAAAAELSEDQRAAFILAEYHELSLAEIASALGVPENTVKTRLFRARQHLRERLAEVRAAHDDGSEDHG